MRNKQVCQQTYSHIAIKMTVCSCGRKAIIKKIIYNEILWIEASGCYSYIHFRSKTKIIVTHRLGIIAQRLPESHFIRIHRGFILSLFDIDTIVGNSLKIGDQLFPIGRTYKQAVLKSFNMLDYLSGSDEEQTNKQDA